MTKVFVGGSRQLSRLSADVRVRLDRIVQKELPVVVGDANGVDKAVQRYLEQRKYPRVEVFCSGAECRNNLGGWPERHIEVRNGDRGFAFYAAKDAAMADEASVGLMIWDGKSVGTLVNVSRLVDLGKTVVVYIAPDKRFVDVKTKTAWDALLANCRADVRREFERRAGVRSDPVASRQAGLF